jgi:hypothetical protein
MVLGQILLPHHMASIQQLLMKLQSISSHADGKVRQVKIEYKNASEFKNGKDSHHEPHRPLCCPLSKRRGIESDAGVGGGHPNSRPPGRDGDDDPGPPLVPAVREKIIAYFDASRLGQVNALFQQNPDPCATFCGSMKILGLD